MVNKRRDFVSAELMEAKARDQQALGEPGAEHWLLQPGEELGARQKYSRHCPVIANPQPLVDVAKELFDPLIGVSVYVVEYD
jgi:hypothetical protein